MAEAPQIHPCSSSYAVASAVASYMVADMVAEPDLALARALVDPMPTPIDGTSCIICIKYIKNKATKRLALHFGLLKI